MSGHRSQRRAVSTLMRSVTLDGLRSFEPDVSDHDDRRWWCLCTETSYPLESVTAHVE